MTRLTPLAPAGPLLLLLAVVVACAAQEYPARPSYASVVSGTHKKRPGQAAPVRGPAPAAAPAPMAGPASPLARPEDVAEAVTRFSLDVARVSHCT